MLVGRRVSAGVGWRYAPCRRIMLSTTVLLVMWLCLPTLEWLCGRGWDRLPQVLFLCACGLQRVLACVSLHNMWCMLAASSCRMGVGAGRHFSDLTVGLNFRRSAVRLVGCCRGICPYWCVAAVFGHRCCYLTCGKTQGVIQVCAYQPVTNQTPLIPERQVRGRTVNAAEAFCRRALSPSRTIAGSQLPLGLEPPTQLGIHGTHYAYRKILSNRALIVMVQSERLSQWTKPRL